MLDTKESIAKYAVISCARTPKETTVEGCMKCEFFDRGCMPVRTILAMKEPMDKELESVLIDISYKILGLNPNLIEGLTAEEALKLKEAAKTEEALRIALEGLGRLEGFLRLNPISLGGVNIYGKSFLNFVTELRDNIERVLKP